MSNVKDFGAKGDGVTDDSKAFNAALASVAADGRLLITKGTYILNSAIVGTFTGDVEILGEAGVVLDVSKSKADPLITFNGTVVKTGIAITGNIVKSTRTIPSAATFKYGDMLQIISTDLWNPTRDYFYKGELAEVESTANGIITVKGALYDSYSSATTTLTQLIMPRFSLMDLSIKGNSNVVGLLVKGLRDVNIKNIYMTGCRYTCMNVTQLYGGIVENCESTDFYYTGTGTSYGLIVASCQGLTVLGGRYLGGRHGICTSGTTPVRDVVIQGATVGNYSLTDQHSLDSHGNTENITIRDCRINNGISILATNALIENNRIVTLQYVLGLSISPEINAGTYIVRGNNISVNGTSKPGISVAPPSSAIASVVIEKLIIENNYVRSIGPTSRGITVTANSKILGVNSITIQNNDVQSTTDCVFTQCNSSFLQIADNYLNTTSASTNAAIKITTDMSSNPFLISRLSIHHNYIRGAAKGILIYPIAAKTTLAIPRIDIESNDVLTSDQALAINNASGSSNVNGVNCNSLDVVAGSYVSIKGSPSMIQFAAASTTPNMKLTSVVFQIASAPASVAYGLQVMGGGNLIVENCELIGSATNAYTNYFQNSGQLRFNNNIVSNFTGKSGISFSESSVWKKPSLVLMQDNQYIACTGSIDTSVRSGTTMTQASTLISYASAIPTISSWNVGDTVYNTTPASAKNICWVCTAAGSPGTWKIFGTIS